MQTFASLKPAETLILRVDPESSNLSGSTPKAEKAFSIHFGEAFSL